MYQSTSFPLRRQVYRHRLVRLSALLIATCLNTNTAKSQEPAEIILELGKGIIKAEVARTPEARERGMMQRQRLETGSGMLFVLDAPEAVCLWMKNTQIPLSAAFIDDSGHIAKIVDLEPNSEEQQCAPVPIRYILEVNRHWFGQNDVKPGVKVQRLPEKP